LTASVEPPHSTDAFNKNNIRNENTHSSHHTVAGNHTIYGTGQYIGPIADTKES
jgi:hypothetical protein